MSNGSCSYNDAGIAECLKNNMSKLKPYLADGIPKYGVPKLEPYFEENVFTNEPFGPDKGVFLSVSNLSIRGCTNYTVENMTISIRDKWLKFEVHCPRISIDGQYKLEGSYGDLPITGSGKVRANYLRCVSKCTINWDMVIRNGEKYINVTNCESKITIGTATDIYLENFIFPDRELSIIVNTALNELVATSAEFWELVSRDLINMAECKLAPKMKNTLNDLFKSVSYSCFLWYLRAISSNDMSGTCLE